MTVCHCSFVFGSDFEPICIVEIEILCVNSFVFHASIDVKFYDFYTCWYAKKTCGQAKKRQLNFTVIMNIYSCGKFFIQSSTLHKY